MEANLQKTEITNNINMPGLSKEAEGFLCQIMSPALIECSNWLATKFRIANTNNIFKFAKEYATNADVELNPTPPKFLLPFIEKASLEDDEYLQKEWAKLLVAASENYNPIHLQYKDILSQIGSEEARLLKEIYDWQIRDKNGEEFLAIANNLIKDYNDQWSLIEAVDAVNGGLEVEEIRTEFYIGSPDVSVKYPDNPKRPELDFLFAPHYDYYTSTSPEILERLALIKIIENEHGPFLALTPFGYNFVETLEDIENPT